MLAAPSEHDMNSILVRSAVRGSIPGLLIFAWTCSSELLRLGVAAMFATDESAFISPNEIRVSGLLLGLLAGALMFALVLSPVWRPVGRDRALAAALTLGAAVGSAFVLVNAAELLAACTIGTMFALALAPLVPPELQSGTRLGVILTGLASFAGAVFLPLLVASSWLDTGWTAMRVFLVALIAGNAALKIALRAGPRPGPASAG
jgi:hypothetical protein